MGETPTLKRIDPEAVPGLFKKWGDMQPIRGRFFRLRHGEFGCCINTIFAVEATGLPRAIKRARRLGSYRDILEITRLSGLAADYALGLALGWDIGVADDSPAAALVVNDPIAYRLGYEDGQAAWEACQRVMKTD